MPDPIFPIEVDSTNGVLALLGDGVPIVAGPWEVGSNLYITAWDSDNSLITMFKSTDAGLTWAQVGTPIAYTDTPTQSPSSCLAGTDIWIATHDPDESGPPYHLTLIKFDTTADEWDAPVVTANSTGTGGTLLAFDELNGQLVVFAAVLEFAVTIGFNVYERTGYCLFDIGGLSAGPWIECGSEDDLEERNWSVVGIGGDDQGTIGMFFYAMPDSTSDEQSVSYQPLVNSTLGSLQEIDAYSDYLEANDTERGLLVSIIGDQAFLAWGAKEDAPGFPDAPLHLYYGTMGATFTFTQTSITGTPNGATRKSVAPVLTADGSKFLVMGTVVDPGDLTSPFYVYSFSSGSFGSPELLGTYTSAFPDPSPAIGSMPFGATSGWSIIISGSIYFWFSGGATPPVNIITPGVGGGTYFPRYINRTLLQTSIYRNFIGYQPPLSAFFLGPNEFDLCLSRDYKLLSLIDRTALSCAKKPDCFLTDESNWQTEPAGFVTFNESGQIPLPDPASGLTQVLSFSVPIGYDGVITGLYNNLTGLFSEGSGDIVWRVRANGRYLQDLGGITITLGSPRQINPVYGGVQLRSGNLVEVLVDAPNTGGSLPAPGFANVLAGLHGWFYPRR